MVLKIDLEKAFDRLKWSFIKQSLHFFKVPPRLIFLIMSCITFSSISILVNGEKTDFFNPTRGIRQGTLFLPTCSLCVWSSFTEDSTMKLTFSPENHIHQERSPPPSLPPFSHLFFIDDLILFTTTTVSNYVTIRNVLQSFGTHSGQRVNHSKSKIIFSKNYKRVDRDHLSQVLSIKDANSFGKYLGFPILYKSLCTQ